MSKEDWELLHLAIQEDNPTIRDNAWIIHKVTEFCKSVGVPILRHQVPMIAPATGIIEKTIWIPEREFDGTTNIEVLERLAQYKGKNATQLIQRYIIDPRIREEEYKLIKRRS